MTVYDSASKALGFLIYCVRRIRRYYLKVRVSFSEIDPNAKCPGCGARDGEIKWIPDIELPEKKQGAIVHRCKVCDANWAELPILQAKDWNISPPKEIGSLFENGRLR